MYEQLSIDLLKNLCNLFIFYVQINSSILLFNPMNIYLEFYDNDLYYIRYVYSIFSKPEPNLESS